VKVAGLGPGSFLKRGSPSPASLRPAPRGEVFSGYWPRPTICAVIVENFKRALNIE